MLMAPLAQADTFVVQTTGDGPETTGCEAAEAPETFECQTLRDAVTAANENGESEDTITFASGVTGTIRLVQDQLELNDYGLTIDGPGAENLTITGAQEQKDGTEAPNFRIFQINGGRTTVEGLRLTGGGGGDYSSDGETTYFGSGGAVSVDNGGVTLENLVVTGNASDYDGGAIDVQNGDDVTLLNTDVTDNTAEGDGGGIDVNRGGSLTVRDGDVSRNDSSEGAGGGISSYGGGVLVTGSTISGNTADDDGGGISHRNEGFRGNAVRGQERGIGGPGRLDKYSFEITDSTVSGNTAAAGGGISLPYLFKYSQSTIERTTIEGNTGTDVGGGLLVGVALGNSAIDVRASTISGNETEGAGGGALFGYLSGDFEMVNSTVSGNTADLGGGLSFGDGDDGGGIYNDNFEVSNSTIAQNTATTGGGGIYLSSYGADGGAPMRRGGEGEEDVVSSATPRITSTLVADNAPQDTDRADDSQGGGIDAAFSLIEAPGDSPVIEAFGGTNVFNTDPKLGGLGENGGVTKTHMLDRTSVAIDRGKADSRLKDDQRGAPRTVDTLAVEQNGGDGTDIGSTESPTGPDAPPQPQAAQPAPPPPPAEGGPVILRRVKPGGMTVNLSPKTDLEAPYRFRVSGRVIPPSGFTPETACNSIGVVNVQVKAGKKTISSRRVALRPDCTYRVNVAFKDDSRFAVSKRLKFTARFLGNATLEPIFPRPVLGRVRPAE